MLSVHTAALISTRCPAQFKRPTIFEFNYRSLQFNTVPSQAALHALKHSTMPRTRAGASALTGVIGATGVLYASLAYLLVHYQVPWENEYFYKFERNTTRLPQQEDIVESDYTRRTVYFTSQGDQLEGWLYEPSPQDPTRLPPCVIMSHGLGAQKDMGLHVYAEQFAQAGLAVLLFDYRGFGGSDGTPRHWVSWRRHVQDLQAALDFVTGDGLGQGVVDSKRVALWGVSYSGGQALMVAANETSHSKVSAVVANEPYLSGEGNIVKAVKERGVVKVIRLLLAAALDKAREQLGLGPIYLRLLGSHSELAILNMDESELKFSSHHNPPPRIGGWKSLTTARMLFDNLGFKPISHIHNIQCPVLFVAGTKDTITPAKFVYQAKEIMGDKAEVVEKPYNHIEMHRKMSDPAELAPVIDFLRRHLGLQPAHVPTQPHEAHPEDTAAEVL